jgi:hypothetical protein
MGIPYEDVSSDEELDLRVREVWDAVDIYSYEVNIDVEEDQKDSLDTVLFTRDRDIRFPFTDDEPELDKEEQQLNNTCDNDTELAKEQNQIQDDIWHAISTT